MVFETVPVSPKQNWTDFFKAFMLLLLLINNLFVHSVGIFCLFIERHDNTSNTVKCSCYWGSVRQCVFTDPTTRGPKR